MLTGLRRSATEDVTERLLLSVTAAKINIGQYAFTLLALHNLYIQSEADLRKLGASSMTSKNSHPRLSCCYGSILFPYKHRIDAFEFLHIPHHLRGVQLSLRS